MISLYWVALKTIWIKEVTRFGRIWVQTLLPPVITMSLYFVIFGNLIGSRIGDMGGVDYMQFIVPGLIMMAVITNSYSNVCSSFFGSKFQRTLKNCSLRQYRHMSSLLVLLVVVLLAVFWLGYLSPSCHCSLFHSKYTLGVW